MNTWPVRTSWQLLARLLSTSLALQTAADQSCPCLADTHYVSRVGTPEAPYASWETASDSIPLALQVADEGDTVRVGAGSYTCDRLNLKRSLQFLGSGRDSTFVQHSGTTGTFVVLADSCLVQGFHFDGGAVDTDSFGGITYHLYYGVYGGKDTAAVVCNNRLSNVDQAIALFETDMVSPTKRVSIIGNELSHFSTAVYLLGASSDIRDNTFYVNDIVGGNPINQIGMSAVITGNRFYRSVRGSGQLIDLRYVSNIDVRNNICVSPPNATAGGIWINRTDHGFPTTGTIANNLCLGADNGISSFGGNVRIVNNIIIGTILDLQYDTAATSPTNVGFNLFWGTRGSLWVDTAARLANGSIFTCAMFEDTTLYRLQAFSPAIDAGDTLLLDPDGTRSDMGPWGGPLGKSYSHVDLPPGVPANPSAAGSDTAVLLNWSSRCEADFDRFELYRDSEPISSPSPILLLASLASDTHYVDQSIEPGGLYYYRVRAVDKKGNASHLSEEVFAYASGITESPVLPEGFVLYPNAPNPFNGSTLIRFSMAADPKDLHGKTKLSICDVLGREVITLVNGILPAGDHTVTWSGVDAHGRAVPSGQYLIKLQVGDSSATEKALLLK